MKTNLKTNCWFYRNRLRSHLRITTAGRRAPSRLGLPRVKPTWIIRGFLLVALTVAFALSALLPAAQAGVCEQGCDARLNTWLGNGALYIYLHSLCEGPDCPSGNTAIGFNTLYTNTTGSNNTATGVQALLSNTTGANNTANGLNALFSNTTGFNNTATGVNALKSNTTGVSNMANGLNALFSNTTGANNTANGVAGLQSNTTGINNTANGVQALLSNTTGANNTANGLNALASNTTGTQNTANGSYALYYNTGGSYNTAEGLSALLHNTGSSNIGLGTNAGSSLTTGSGNVCIGVNVFGVAGESNTTRIRNVYSSVASGRAVYVNSDNKIGTLVSSRRFKDEIKPMDKASETILALKPVTFRYKKEIEPNGAIMFGLIAEEVEKVDPDLVTRDAKGEVETVRYDAVNAMLLNEFLKAHRKMEEQEVTITQLKNDFGATIAQLTARLEEQAAQIQKVSAQLEASKPAPQTVANK